MDVTQQKKNITAFVKKWSGKGQEDEDDRSYWIDLLQSIFDVKNVTDYLQFQKKVKVDGHKKRIDVYVPDTHVLIEQKSLGIALDKKHHQSDDIDLTPYEQAKRYSDNLGHSETARWIITSNFSDIWIYDMEEQEPEPIKISLDELPKKYHLLEFLVSENVKKLNNEMELSVKAGEIVGLLYDAFHAQYHDPDNEESLKSLNELCVRLVFCLYAEDSEEIFGKKNMFHDYMEQFDTVSSRDALRELFKVLDQDPQKGERDQYLREDLAAFPYVNGGLFSNEDIEIPPFTDEIRDLLLNKASMDFDWSEISPTIFGAVFESTLNQETRRSGGMHYTSVQNIHKVIDPLFLDELTHELDSIIYDDAEMAERIRKEREEKFAEHNRKHAEIMKIKNDSQREYELDLWKKEEKKITNTSGYTRRKNTSINDMTQQLDEFQDKIASLKFLDPACGSGNFLTESYLSLRRLENRVIEEKMNIKGQSGQMQLADLTGDINPIKVSIQQFYGIEIHDFAATVAKTALWIAESQMLRETERIINTSIDFLPLKSYVNITEGNALKIDWNNVEPTISLNYIMGNPPFVGGMYMSKEQKKEITDIFPDLKGVGELDYVCGWYKKAAEFIEKYNVKVAFVSTNSICQGQQVLTFWKYLMEHYPIEIDFAYTTFVWNSEAKGVARVHCIIVGVSKKTLTDKERTLFSQDGSKQIVDHISPYLSNTPDVFIESRSNPLCNVPAMRFGSMPRDGGGFILTEEERQELIKNEPLAEKWIHPYIGAVEFLQNKTRYCLWLVGANPGEISKCPTVKKRVEGVREFRLASKAAGTRKFAKTPTLFCQIAQPNTDYIMFPKTSSGKRNYIPLGFQTKDVIASDLVFLIPNASIYHFGILMSNIHNAWMRTVCGRLKSDYRYSKDIVYNNFPWPNPTDDQKKNIENTAQGILDARNAYPNESLSVLYDPSTMPPELTKAHEANDRAVRKAYGFDSNITEPEIVAELMNMYQKLI